MFRCICASFLCISAFHIHLFASFYDLVLHSVSAMKKVIPVSPTDEFSSVDTHIHDNTEAYGAMDEGKRKEHLQDLEETECRVKEMIEAYDAKWRAHTISEQMDIAHV